MYFFILRFNWVKGVAEKIIKWKHSNRAQAPKNYTSTALKYMRLWDEALQMVFHGLCTRWRTKSRYIYGGGSWMNPEDWTERLTTSAFDWCSYFPAIYRECSMRASFISFRSNDIYWFSALDVIITELVRSGWCADGSFIIIWVSGSSVTRMADLHLFEILE